MTSNRMVVRATVAIAAIASFSCSYRYTKAFHLSDQFPPRRTQVTITDMLPERFGPWIVQVHIWSVHESKDKARIAANSYKCWLAFRLPEDTSVWMTDSMGKVRYQPDRMFVGDTSQSVIVVDSVSVTFEPTGVQEKLVTEAGAHRSFDCGSVHIPESVDSLTLSFVARLESPDGVEITKKEFAARFFRWEYRWNAWLPLE